MKSKAAFYTGAVLLLTFVLVIPAFGAEEDEDIQRISKEDVRKLIGSPDVTIIDVRYEKNWEKSDRKVRGAVRENPNEISSWTGKYPKDRMLVLYCD